MKEYIPIVNVVQENAPEYKKESFKNTILTIINRIENYGGITNEKIKNS